MYEYTRSVPLRAAAALFFLLCAYAGFESGVGASERPEIVADGHLAKIYYSLSLFVMGGVDLGMPTGGPLAGRILVWLAYFGAPILAVSTLIEALLRAISPQSWTLRRLRNHVIVAGENELALSYIRALRQHNPKLTIVVATPTRDRTLLEEFRQSFDARVVQGDITHEYFLRDLRVEHAKKIILLNDTSVKSYEAAALMINTVPDIGERIVIHCHNLRFMRSMENTVVGRNCVTFNTYQIAASGLVHNRLLRHFRETHTRDVVVLAGFGRFGQTVLEELQRAAHNELDTVAIIDIDARRRVMVADEQMEFSGDFRRLLYEGDIAHPEVWDRLRDDVDTSGSNVVFVLGTGRGEENLRTSLWIRRKHPEAMVVARTARASMFARQLGEEHNIVSVSISDLVEENIPRAWIEVA